MAARTPFFTLTVVAVCINAAATAAFAGSALGYAVFLVILLTFAIAGAGD